MMKEIELSKIGNLVRLERQRRGLTQQALATMASVSKGRVEAIENGRCLDMGLGTVAAVISALGFRLRALVPEEPNSSNLAR